MTAPAYKFERQGTVARHTFQNPDYSLTLDVDRSRQTVQAWVRPHRESEAPATAEFTFGDLHLFAHAADYGTGPVETIWPDDEAQPAPGAQLMRVTITPPRENRSEGTVTLGTATGGVTLTSGRVALLDQGQNLEGLMADHIPTFLKVQIQGLAVDTNPDH